MADSESTSPYPTELKHAAFLLRAQGLSFRRISKMLRERGTPVPARTLNNWAVSAEGAPLIDQLTAQLRAGMHEQAAEVVPTLFRKIKVAARDGDAKAADAWSRAIANITRGIVADKVDVTPPSRPNDADELAALLARHGVVLSVRPDP